MSDRLQDFKNSGYERPNQNWLKSEIQSPAHDEPVGFLKQRSVRARRKIVTIAITAFTFGALLIAFNSPYRNDLIVPGSLASNHAQLLTEHGVDRCAACHENANKSFSSWVSGIFGGSTDSGACQSELCMECHKNNISVEYALNPHSVSLENLAERTKRIQQVSFRDSESLSGLSDPSKKLACATCHREHHGETDLSK